MQAKESRRSVGILGTGDFSRALAKRLYFSGYDVILGSRRPENKFLTAVDECFCNINIVTTEECIKSVPIIFVAVHVENYKDLLEEHGDILNGKIVIDISNRDKPSQFSSNAEYLQKLIPGAIVVKAFNVISAYAMENDYNTSSRQVFVASNEETARLAVSNIARDMNFTPVDFGGLLSSRKIERHPLRLFPDWRGPIGFSVAVFNIWLLLLIYLYYIDRDVFKWDQLFVKVPNKAICMTGITVLAVTYLASSFAAIFQVYYGTKYIRFPRWLDKWLKCRKQLGLVAFTLIFCHVIMSLLMMSPTYWRSWYHSSKVVIPRNESDPFVFENVNWMIWKGEAACLAGILSFIVMCFICASTLPSVTDTLNWREWRFVQSRLGHTALLLAVIHVLIMGMPGWLKSPYKIYKSITFLSSIIPWITLLLKLIFSLPCVNRYVMRIRKGWERNPELCRGKCVNPVQREGYIVMKMDDSSEHSNSDTFCPCSGDAVPMLTIEKTICPCTNEKIV